MVPTWASSSLSAITYCGRGLRKCREAKITLLWRLVRLATLASNRPNSDGLLQVGYDESEPDTELSLCPR